MLSPKLIVLVGPMGAGKSTIGRLLASVLQVPFLDTDSVIEERTGADIPWIFDVEGEDGFRKRETAVLQELMEVRPLVLATGGGIVLREENQIALKAADSVIYLTADPELLAQRTEKDKKRPLLQVDNPKEKVLSLLAERDPLYRQVATRIVVTDTRSPKSVAQEIAAQIS